MEQKKNYTLEEKLNFIKNSNNISELNKDILPSSYQDDYYFVSYSHGDYKEVLSDILLLEDQDLRFWYDTDIHIGENWEHIAKSYISKFQCKGVIFYLSEKSLLSPACKKEIEYVIDNGKQFFSINIPLDGKNTTSGYQMLLDLKSQGKKMSNGEEISDEYLGKVKEAFNNDVIFLSQANDTITRKSEKIKELKGEDLFEFEFAYEYTLKPQNDKIYARLMFCNDNSLIRVQLPTFIQREKIKNLSELEEFEKENNISPSKTLVLKGISATTFTNNYCLEEIVLPQTIEFIEDSAFRNCTNLTKVNWDDLHVLKYIGDNAFSNCRSLKNFTIPENVKNIGKNAFYGCSSIDSIIIPDSVKTIGEYAFNSTFLLNVIIGKSVESIGDGAFQDCLIDSIVIPDSVKTIGKSAFAYCFSLSTVEIGKSVESIGDYAFSDCFGLNSIVIPDSVKTIGKSAFERCESLANVIIGKSVESIGDYAFSDCFGLNSIVIPKSVKSIGDYAFSYCLGLNSIVIPKSVKRIGLYVFKHTPLKTIKNHSQIILTKECLGLHNENGNQLKVKITNRLTKELIALSIIFLIVVAINLILWL